MGKTSGSFVNARGQKLYTVEWQPEGDVKAVVLWNHGFGEYADRFDESFKAWSDAGMAVYCFDVHGMGLSEPLDEPNRALVKSFQYIVDDSLQFLKEVVEPSLKTRGITAPLFVAGNSLGGLTSSYVVLARQDAFAGIAMLCPALDVEWTPILRVQAAFGNVLARLFPRAKLVPAVRPEDMSQDPAVVQAYLDDPIMYHGKIRALSANESLKAFRALTGRRKEFRLPMLGVHGTRDRCTSLPALKAHLAGVSSADKTLHEIQGGYHDLLNGPERQEVRALIRDWLLDHAAAAASKAGGKAAEAAAAAATDVQVTA